MSSFADFSDAADDLDSTRTFAGVSSWDGGAPL
jgi:hypothetical protein